MHYKEMEGEMSEKKERLQAGKDVTTITKTESHICLYRPAESK